MKNFAMLHKQLLDHNYGVELVELFDHLNARVQSLEGVIVDPFPEATAAALAAEIAPDTMKQENVERRGQFEMKGGEVSAVAAAPAVSGVTMSKDGASIEKPTQAISTATMGNAPAQIGETVRVGEQDMGKTSGKATKSKPMPKIAAKPKTHGKNK